MGPSGMGVNSTSVTNDQGMPLAATTPPDSELGEVSRDLVPLLQQSIMVRLQHVRLAGRSVDRLGTQAVASLTAQAKWRRRAHKQTPNNDSGMSTTPTIGPRSREALTSRRWPQRAQIGDVVVHLHTIPNLDRGKKLVPVTSLPTKHHEEPT